MKAPSNIIRQIAQTIHDKKGTNIVGLDVRGISSMTDFVIIATGNVDRHVIALANELEDLMKKEGERPIYVEGKQLGDWIVLDYFQVVIHLLLPEMRQRYKLERLWPEAKVVEFRFNL